MKMDKFPSLAIPKGVKQNVHTWVKNSIQLLEVEKYLQL